MSDSITSTHRQDLTGQLFGDWEVLRRSSRKSASSNRRLKTTAGFRGQYVARRAAGKQVRVQGFHESISFGESYHFYAWC